MESKLFSRAQKVLDQSTFIQSTSTLKERVNIVKSLQKIAVVTGLVGMTSLSACSNIQMPQLNGYSLGSARPTQEDQQIASRAMSEAVQRSANMGGRAAVVSWQNPNNGDHGRYRVYGSGTTPAGDPVFTINGGASIGGYAKEIPPTTVYIDQYSQSIQPYNSNNMQRRRRISDFFSENSIQENNEPQSKLG